MYYANKYQYTNNTNNDSTNYNQYNQYNQYNYFDEYDIETVKAVIADYNLRYYDYDDALVIRTDPINSNYTDISNDEEDLEVSIKNGIAICYNVNSKYHNIIKPFAQIVNTDKFDYMSIGLFVKYKNNIINDDENHFAILYKCENCELINIIDYANHHECKCSFCCERIHID